MEIRQYKFNALTILDESNRFSRSWPYVANTVRVQELPMSADKPQEEWLILMEPERYPTLVEISDQIWAKVQERGGGRRDFLTAVENFFLTPGRFQYTLDYTDVKRDDSLDPVEDFVRNHRSGHCEAFAAATTLMLRRQGIPARLVVGYCGGEYNQLSKTFLVHASNAHAWVEAYLPPEDCTESMRRNRQAGPGGAWMIVESTPAMADAVIEKAEDEAIDLARNVWDDYVIGREEDHETRTSQSPVYGWLNQLDLDWWGEKIRQLEVFISRPAVKYGVPTSMALLALLITLKSYLWRDQNEPKKIKAGFLRRMVARAVAFVSPELAEWVIGRRGPNKIGFYRSMEKILAAHDLHRDPTQTHREFASEVIDQYADHPNHDLIRESVSKITQLFNQVRFGNEPLNESTNELVRQDLAALKTALASSN